MTNGNPEYAEAPRCTTARKSGSKNCAIPFSNGDSPSGARQLGSGAKKSSNACNASLSFTSSWFVILPILCSGLNFANSANFKAVVGPTL